MVRQCALLGVARSSLYYRLTGDSAEELALMRRIDRIFTDHPMYGSRRMQGVLAREGTPVGRRRIRRLMRKMGLWAVGPRRNTSRPHPAHPVHPYLLRGLKIDRPNHVWATDITYIPMAKGFLYRVAIVDWATPRVLAWRLSNTLTTDFCVAALEEAIARYGAPEIFNTDQGCQLNARRGVLRATGDRPAGGLREGRCGFVDNSPAVNRGACRGKVWRLSHRAPLCPQAPQRSCHFG